MTSQVKAMKLSIFLMFELIQKKTKLRHFLLFNQLNQTTGTGMDKLYPNSR